MCLNRMGMQAINKVYINKIEYFYSDVKLKPS